MTDPLNRLMADMDAVFRGKAQPMPNLLEVTADMLAKNPQKVVQPKEAEPLKEERPSGAYSEGRKGYQTTE